jgi:uncharacterized damage-inducible protein DinB
MDTYLHELYRHQEWADAEHWLAFEGYPSALADKAIRERLHHIHLVQHGFLWIAGPRKSEAAFKKLEQFSDATELKQYARQGLRDLNQLLTAMTPEQLEESIEVPWFKPLRITRRHALMQAAMHSHYHRGQNATRLREIGGVPPQVDFIVWLKDGQPSPRWA